MTSSYRGTEIRLADARRCYDAWVAERRQFARMAYLVGVALAALSALLAVILLRPEFATQFRVPQTAAGLFAGVLLAAASMLTSLALVLMMLAFSRLKWDSNVHVRVDSAT